MPETPPNNRYGGGSVSHTGRWPSGRAPVGSGTTSAESPEHIFLLLMAAWHWFG